ncbi:MAG TPA: hypothetical protein VFT90_14735 [Chryseosolibacter sp.]|nr:hypothetical protein [Chryseosolibacter sp.]
MSKYTTKAWAVILILVTSLSTGVIAQNTSSSSTETSISASNRKVHRWSHSSGTTDFNVEMRGEVELTDDDRDIKSISEDGYLRISKTVFGSRRSLVIESLGDGRIKKEYYEGRTKMPWDPNGKAWLSEILPEVVRTSTIGAESRVKRFFRKGGAPAVLDEIDRIDSDHVKEHYANLLMKENVQPKDYAVIIREVVGDMDSDHYITNFLKTNAPKFLRQKDATSAMFAAASDMESDHYKTIVITEALKGADQSTENLRQALDAAADMDSDHYISLVLSDLLKQDNLTDMTLTELVTTTKAIESDHYRSLILKEALQKPNLSPSAHQQLLESVKEMSSDHYITDVIVNLMVIKLSDETMNDLLEILPAVESDHYRTEIFTRLLKNQKLTDGQLGKVLEACGNMDSDHYKTIVLKDALSRSSSNGTLIEVLNAVAGIDSDHYAAEVLLSAAPKVKNGSDEARNAYRAAARGISSDHDYGRALKAIEQ